MYAYVGNDPLNREDPTGKSTLVFDGAAHTITLFSASGQPIAAYAAGNNVALHFHGAVTSGPMTDGSHPVIGGDQHGATRHLGGSPNGPYGKNGDIRVASYKGIRGNTVRGAAVHAGRANIGGPKAKTLACIRTTGKAMAKINSTAKTAPLNTIVVSHNGGNIKQWEADLRQWNRRNR